MTELEFKQWIFDPMRLELSPQALLLLLYIKMQCRQRYVFSAESMTKAMRFKDIRTMRRYKAELLDKGLIHQERCQYGLRITIPALDYSDSTYHAPSEKSDSTKYASSDSSDSTYHAPSHESDSTYHAPSHESDSAKYAPSEKADSTFYAPSENDTESDSTFCAPSEKSDSTKYAPSENSDSTFCADQIVHSVQSDSTFHAPSDSTFHAPLIIYKDIYKGTNKGDSAKNELEQKSQSDSFSLSTDDNCLRERKQTYSELEDVSEMDDETQAKIRDLMSRFSK